MIPVEAPSSTVSTQAVLPRKDLILWGFSGAETAGTAATAECVIRHGVTASAPMLLAPINFAADGFGYPTFFPRPLLCPNGIFLERVTGNTTLIFYIDYE